MKHSKELEAVARAIYEANPIGRPWSLFRDGSKEPFYRAARAALEAIREPTEGMLEAVAEMDDDGSGEWEPSFTAAIDYALRDTTGEAE